MAFKPCKCQLKALSRTRCAQDWVPCGKAPIAIFPLLMLLLTWGPMLCEVLLTGLSSGNSRGPSLPSNLPTCCSSQVLPSSPGGPPCLHLCPSSHAGGYGRMGRSRPGTPSAAASEGIPPRLLPSARAGLSSLKEHRPGTSISLHLGLATHVWSWQ